MDEEITTQGCIYLITNEVNGKTYVGKTKNLHKRWRMHKYAVNRISLNNYLYKAIRKYGIENFTIKLIDDDNSSEKEIYWIAELKPEYNMTKGGDGGWINDQTGKHWKVKDTTNMRISLINSLEKRKLGYVPKMSNGNNYQCNYIIYTPWGEFDTWKNACNAAKQLRLQGRKDVVTDNNTLQSYCKANRLLNEKGNRTYREWRGKYTRDLGFDFKYKSDIKDINSNGTSNGENNDSNSKRK